LKILADKASYDGATVDVLATVTLHQPCVPKKAGFSRTMRNASSFFYRHRAAKSTSLPIPVQAHCGFSTHSPQYAAKICIATKRAFAS
jgi:hypothetical protein